MDYADPADLIAAIFMIIIRKKNNNMKD